MKIYLVLFFTYLLASGCISQPSGRLLDTEKGSDEISTNSGGGSVNDGQGAANNGETGGEIAQDEVEDLYPNGKTELRHFIDPFDGTYKTKITVPKNFSGFMYISGLNIQSLSSKILGVRFKFGRDLAPIEVSGVTVGRGEGITPTTDIAVLILDMNDRPFEKVRLLYDLYDYKSYSAGEASTTDPRDDKLYCRGLRKQYDPTFIETNCSSSTSKCLYSYAKILDAGLYRTASSIFLSPTDPEVDTVGSGYNLMSSTDFLKRCLPDNIMWSNLYKVLGSSSSLAGDITYASGLGGITSVGGYNYGSYSYRGPYRMNALSEWEILGDAIYGTFGIFKARMGGAALAACSSSSANCATGGYQSRLFPMVGKMSLSSNVEHFSSTEVDSTAGAGRELTSLISAGDTDYMDGCNLRVSNFDVDTLEGISSCNVIATVEVYTKDAKSGQETILASSDQIKLQLIRPSQTDSVGREVLYSALKSCSSSNACGSEECCYNNRCWTKDLVSQCLEDTHSEGNYAVGQSCTSDYQCASLCCDQSLGTCRPHIANVDEQVLCSKSPGQQCISKEWCRKDSVSTCKVYITGTSPTTGQTTCALRCYPVPTFGDCINGICVTPEIPAIPSYDPNDCSNAIPLPR